MEVYVNQADVTFFEKPPHFIKVGLVKISEQSSSDMRLCKSLKMHCLDNIQMQFLW